MNGKVHSLFVTLLTSWVGLWVSAPAEAVWFIAPCEEVRDAKTDAYNRLDKCFEKEASLIETDEIDTGDIPCKTELTQFIDKTKTYRVCAREAAYHSKKDQHN